MTIIAFIGKEQMKKVKLMINRQGWSEMVGAFGQILFFYDSI